MHAFNPLNEDDIGLAYIFQDPGIIGGMHGGTTTASKNELEIKYIISGKKIDIIGNICYYYNC